MTKRKKVFVAMSGGVDSSVAAALLKEQGFDVTGIFMKNWSEKITLKKNGLLAETQLCPWVTDQEDMRRVCSQLEIPFYTFDFEADYKKNVIDYFFEGYQAGRTPNPDVMCNKEIKFKLYLEKSLRLGADFIATGHYARIKAKKGKFGKEFHLLKGMDRSKDQSYFLYNLNQKQLSRIIFPVGNYTKSQIRSLAREKGLVTHNKKDSQGICFIGEVNIEEFLKTRIKEKHGKIVTKVGKIIGTHQGLCFYTIGQRKGIKIGGGIPYYVVGKNLKNNTLIVAMGSRNPELYKKWVTISELTWVISPPKLPLDCGAKIRYRQPDQKATVDIINKKIKVTFKEPQRAVTPGQSVVFYRGTELLGGGVI